LFEFQLQMEKGGGRSKSTLLFLTNVTSCYFTNIITR